MSEWELITSRHNARVQQAAKLRDRRQRDRQGRFLIDGARELDRAIDAGVQLDEVFVCRELCRTAIAHDLLARLGTLVVSIAEVTAEVFEKLAFGDRAEGVVGVARTAPRSIADLIVPADAIVAVLVGVEKPGNLGAVLRSADGAGIAALIVADGGTDLYNPNAIRASLGTIFSVPVCSATTAETLAWLRASGRRIYSARIDGAINYTAADFRGPAAIVLGSEAEGLPAAWLADDIAAIALPMQGAADSLNVSATAAVLFYEALRQRSA